VRRRKRELAARVARLDQYHAHSEAARFQAQTLAQPFDRELAGAVDARKGHAEDAAQRADVDDVAGALLAHDRQRGAADAQHAEEVGLHLRARVGDGRVFDRSHQGPAGVVHHRVETAGFFHNGGHRARHGVIVVYVHGSMSTPSKSLAWLRLVPNTRHPRAARWRAMACPMPEEAPVTRTTFRLAGIRGCAHRVIITM
jgi:hypothetical protein